MLMFLPGLICDSRIFAPQAEAFPDALVIDGYGMADSLAEMARIALAAADERGADKLDVFGHSMGGRIAMEVVRLAPQRVRRLALVSTGIHPVGEGEPAKRAALQKVGYDEGFEALVDSWLPPMVAEANRETAAYNAMRDMCLSQGQATFDAQIKALLGRAPFEDLLAGLTCPTLVMTGENDAWAPPSQHETIASKIANSRLVVVPGAGHMIQLEAPDAVNAAIADWLEMPAGD
ncbi:alpha/beta fold hydrolase [Aurantiacibacter poecillastricola]|uniref:alpha/beta fold hydrolase n=1 Tax=Aurantiacibacter poecillastricola TaxID=3064385 RepID=UPI00273FA74E|nr:alpha/beta fold hydrolase [Aurantiacibacter sp. 219JJ12-13]MDP5260086.1 alpha/beta fold hydrolase [Aurantiacibacter sp. 219JJ12-13]